MVDVKSLVKCFDRYMTEGGHAVTRALFEANLSERARRPDFRGDMDVLLRPGLTWDFDTALKIVLNDLVARLPGEPWKGDG